MQFSYIFKKVKFINNRLFMFVFYVFYLFCSDLFDEGCRHRKSFNFWPLNDLQFEGRRLKGKF
jgi:hypothetical protein